MVGSCLNKIILSELFCGFSVYMNRILSKRCDGMKKATAFIIAFAFVLGVASCSTQEEEVRQQIQFPQNNATAQETATLKEPPALTVVYGENNSIEALRGTSSWTYQNEDGTWTGIEADSMHPLDAKEYMPNLTLLPVITSSCSPLSAGMQWDTIPDNVTVRCWSDAYWGQYDAESEDLTVRTLMVDSNTEAAPIISIELKDGNYVYEVIAEWNSAETYHGKACYSFYTVKQNVK